MNRIPLATMSLKCPDLPDGLRRGLVIVLVAIGVCVAACGEGAPTGVFKDAPTAPSDLGPSGSRNLATESSAYSSGVFPLLNGTFAITTQTGDALFGGYVGELIAQVSGRSTVTLQLEVTGNTGVWKGTTRTLEAEGRGPFSDGGHVVLTLEGRSPTVEPGSPIFHVTLVGTSSLSCSPDGRIVLTLVGHGTAGTIGRVDAEFSSEISNTACFE